MSRRSDPAPPSTETPADLWQKSLHARRLASCTLDKHVIAILTSFADELEARAAALEAARQTDLIP